MLLQINEVIINNMEDLECEVADRLELVKQRIKASNMNTSNDCDKYRSDICLLMQLLQNAYLHDDWNLEGMEFQTVNPAVILGNCHTPCSQQQNRNPSVSHQLQSCQTPCSQQQNRNPSGSHQLQQTCNNTEQLDSRSRCTNAQDMERDLQNHVFEQTTLMGTCGTCGACPKYVQETKWSDNPPCDNSGEKDMENLKETQSYVCSPNQQRQRHDNSYSICRDERNSPFHECIDLTQNTCGQAQPPPPYNASITFEQQQSVCETPSNFEQHEPRQYLENANLMNDRKSRGSSVAKCFTCFSRQDSFYNRSERHPTITTNQTPDTLYKQNKAIVVQSLRPAPSYAAEESNISLNNSSNNNLDSSQCSCNKTNSSQNNTANLRALAIEVAAKYDEINELKRQICSLEDEIQKAQQKITLKDNVIRELRNDLKSNKTKLSGKGTESCPCSSSCLNVPPINLEAPQSSRSASTQVSIGHDSSNQAYNDDCSHFDSLSNADHMEHQKLKALETELNELFEVTKDFKRQNLEFHRKRLSDIFQKSEAEKAEAYRKLDFIRRQLIDLEASGGETCKCYANDSDSGFSSKCETDQDAKILNAIRKRLRRLNDSVFEHKKCVQQLQIENNELSTCLSTERAFAEQNSNALKELADMLCGITGSQFSYDDIYSTSAREKMNPFCKAIMQMKCNYEESDRKLRNVLAKKCKQVEELQQEIMCNENNMKQEHGNAKLCNNNDAPNNTNNSNNSTNNLGNNTTIITNNTTCTASKDGDVVSVAANTPLTTSSTSATTTPPTIQQLQLDGCHSDHATG